MRRLLILTVFLTAACAQNANAAPLIGDLRPANAAEQQSMNAALTATLPDTPFTFVSANVSPSLGLGVSKTRYGYTEFMSLFTVYPDGTVLLGGEASLPVSCSETREVLIFDEVAEQLGMVPPDECSLGKPAHLTRSEVSRIGRLRAAANRGIEQFNKANKKCKSFTCIGRVRDRYYSRPVKKLIAAAERAERLVSWSFCQPKLEALGAAAISHRDGLEGLIFYSFIDDRSEVSKAKRRIKRAAKKSRTAWNGVKAECIKYPSN